MERLTEQWKAEDGYFTIEAAFIVTMVFLLTFAVLLTGLYICDLNQAKSFLNRRAAELSLDTEPYNSDEAAKDRNQIKSQLFVTNLTDFTISKTEEQVKGTIALSMKRNIPMIGDWFGGLWTDRFSLALDVGNNADMMRRWEQIE